MISDLATNTDLSKPWKYPHFYWTCMSDSHQTKAKVEFLLALNWSYISILNSDDNYGRDGAHTLAASKDLCVYMQNSMAESKNTTSYAAMVMKKLKENLLCKVIVLWGHLGFTKYIFRAVSYTHLTLPTKA